MFGERFSILRKDKNYTQKRIVELLNEVGIEITTQAVSSWEKKNVEPPYKTLIALTKIFNVSIEYLIGADTEISKEVIKFTESTQNLKQEFEQIDKNNLCSEEKKCLKGTLKVFREITSVIFCI